MPSAESDKKPTREKIVRGTGWGFLVRREAQQTTPPLSTTETHEELEKSAQDQINPTVIKE
jgi:hypothetical protein